MPGQNHVHYRSNYQLSGANEPAFYGKYAPFGMPLTMRPSMKKRWGLGADPVDSTPAVDVSINVSRSALSLTLGAIGGIAMVMLYNTKGSPRPIIGGEGSGRFITGAGWWLVGSSIGGHIGKLLAP